MQAQDNAVLFGFVCLSPKETERGGQDGQSKQQLYPQMLMKKHQYSHVYLHLFDSW